MSTVVSPHTAAAWFRRISTVVSLTFLGRLIGFLYPVIVLRRLDSHAAGLAFFFMNTGYFVVQPVSGGPAMAMVRPIAAASNDDERAQWLRAAIKILGPGVAFSFAVALIVCLTSNAPVLPMILMVIGLSADTMYFQILTARSRYTVAANYRLIANIAQLIALLLVLALGFRSVTLIVGIFALSYGFGFVAVEPHQRALIGLLKHSVSATRSQLRKLIATATPTLVTGLAYSGIVGLDTYLVRLSRPDLVAGYGAAKTLASPLLLVSLAVMTIIQPETARANEDQAHRIRRHMLLIGSGIGALAIIACWALSGLAVHIVYGARYPEAATTLAWLGAGATFLGLHTLLQVWCWGRDRYIAPLISLSTGALIAIICNLLLVPELGARGAGIAVCLGTGVATAVLVGLSRPANTSHIHLSDQPTTDPA
jgi:O-antigen/teichoic acid export membrane protein